MQEVWKEIKDFPGYWVSSEGRIWSMKKGGRMLQFGLSGARRNYYNVALSKNGKSHTKKVHRIVMETFHPDDDFSMTVNHINENTLDNRLENLEWMTRKENIRYSSGQWVRQETLEGEKVAEYPSMRAASEAIGCNVRSIYEHCNRGTPYKNFIWKKIDNPNKK